MIQQRIPLAWRPWVITLSSALFFTYDFVQLNIFNSIGQAFRQDFLLTSTELGMLAGFYLTAQTLAMFFCGYCLDRFPTRRVILSGMGLCVVSTLALALSPSVFWAWVFRGLAGLTGAFCFLSALLIASTWFSPSKMSTIVGLVVTMGMLGGVIAQSPMEYWSSLHGWRHALLLNALVGGALWLWMYAVVQPGPLGTRRQPSFSVIEGLKEVVAQPQNWFAGLYTALMNLILFVFGAVWGNHYLMAVHQVSSADAAWIVTQLFFGTIVGSPCWGALVDYTKARRPVMLLGSAWTLGLLGVLFYAHDLAVGSLALIFFALGLTTATQVLSYPHIAAFNKSMYLGIAESFAALFILGLGAVWQPLMGWLMEVSRESRGGTALEYLAQDFDFASKLFFVIVLLAALCAAGLRRPKSKIHHYGG